MADGWIGPWQDITGVPNSDDEGMQQLIAACGYDGLQEMYSQITNNDPVISDGAEEYKSSTPHTADGIQDGEIIPTLLTGEIFVNDDESIPSFHLGSPESANDDLLHFESANGPHLISDNDMDELIKMYDVEPSTSQEGGVNLGGGDTGHSSATFAYPTPTSSPTEPELDMNHVLITVLERLNSTQALLESLQQAINKQSRKLHTISSALSQLGDDSCESMAASARWRNTHEQWTNRISMSLDYLTERRTRN